MTSDCKAWQSACLHVELDLLQAPSAMQLIYTGKRGGTAAGRSQCVRSASGSHAAEADRQPASEAEHVAGLIVLTRPCLTCRCALCAEAGKEALLLDALSVCALPLAATQQSLAGSLRVKLSFPRPLYHLRAVFDAATEGFREPGWLLAVDCQLFIGELPSPSKVTSCV